MVPQLGAFLVKEPDHTVIFSPLLTRDDGVLQGLLLKAGMTELEVSGALYRLLFDVRYVAENGGDYILEGVGRFSLDASGALLFTAAPAVEQVAEPSGQVEAVEAVEEIVAQVAAQESEVQQEIVEEADQVGADDLQVVEEPIESVHKSVVDRYSKPSKSRKGSKATQRKGGVDWWLVIGVIAGVIAVAAIAYGFLRDGAEPFSITNLF